LWVTKTTEAARALVIDTNLNQGVSYEHGKCHLDPDFPRG